MFKKIITAAVCAVFTVSMLGGCAAFEESSSKPIYGEAISEVAGDIYLIYDGRFVTNDEMKMLSDYYLSIQNKDYALFETTQPKDYLDFLKEQNDMSIEDILNRRYNEDTSSVGEGFTFLQIEVTDCGDKTLDRGIDDVLEIVDGIYEDMGKEKSFSDTLKEAKYVRYDVTAENMGREYILRDQKKYIFNCEDGIYIF